MFSRQYTLALETIKRYKQPVLLFYPWTNYRKVLLEHTQFSTSPRIQYYQIVDQHDTFESWVKPLLHYIASEFTQVTADIELIGQQTDPRAIGSMLGTAQTRSDFPAMILFLEGWDTIPQDEAMRQFMTAWIHHSPPQFQLAISSQFIQMQPWAKMLKDGEAILLGTQRNHQTIRFVPQPTPRPQVEVRALQGGEILVNGQPLDVQSKKLAYQLTMFLVDSEPVTRKDAFDVFWKHIKKPDATNNFHVTKSKLADMLKPYVPQDTDLSDIITFKQKFYALGESLVWHYDALDFEVCVDQALQVFDNDALQETLLLRALEMYQTEFAPSIHMEWAAKRREELRQTHIGVLTALGKLRKRQGKHAEALQLFSRILKKEQHREDISREVMKLHHGFGNSHQMRDTYYRLVNHLAREQMQHPSRETRELYDMLNSNVSDQPGSQ